jgi:hypothetical protein
LRPGLGAAAALAIVTTLLVATLNAMQAVRTTPTAGFDLGAAMWQLSHPSDVGGWVQLLGIVSFAIVGGMFIAANRARRARRTEEAAVP